MKKTARFADCVYFYLKEMFLCSGYMLLILTVLIRLYNTESKDLAVTVLHENVPQKMDLNAYVTGVVLAEMPASFADEALKAQAIAARTFALKVKNSGKHSLYDICSDSGCCQGYISKNEYISMGGKEKAYQHISDAVRATSNRVITYQGKLIEAPYFSCSGGWTESAVAVWGNDFPYLISKESPGEEETPHFQQDIFFGDDEVRKRLNLPQNCSVVPHSITYTSGQGIQSICFGDTELSGVEFRSKMELPSTYVTIKPESSGLQIRVNGFGHRVGLSQYGAEAMAERGHSYNQILQYYYPGTKVTKLEDVKKR